MPIVKVIYVAGNGGNMTNYYKKLSKSGKIIVITLAIILIVSILAGIGTGIYFGVMTRPYKGTVLEVGTNTPIANVSVTDGKNVAVTDKDGNYKLKGWYKSKFVTVTIPSGYWTEDYYAHRDNKVKSYDFRLKRKTTDDTNHTFLQVSDTEIGKEGVGSWVYDIKNAAKLEQAAFIMHTGDLCYEDGLRKHKEGMNSNNMEVPVRYGMGNHDYIKYGDYAESLFEEIYGPTYYSFDVGNVHYIVTPFFGWADEKQHYTMSNVAQWLANDIKNVDDGKKIVMFNHDYAPNEDEYVMKYGLKKIDLKEKGLIAWLFGHWHYNYVNEKDGVLNIATSKPESGGIDGSPNGIRVVEIEGGRVKSARLRYAYETAREINGDTVIEPNIDGQNWKTKLSGRGYWGQPISDKNSVYLATATDSYPNTNAVYRINADTGEEVWKFDVKNSVRNDITLYNGKILALDSEGRLYCINADTGILLWEKDLGLSNPRNTSMNTVVDGDKVYVGSSKKLFCLNANDGNLVWERDEKDNTSSPSKLVISGDNLLVHCHWRRIFALNKNTGKPVWSNKENSNAFSSVVPYGSNLIFQTGSLIAEYDNLSGSILQSKEIGEYVFDSAASPYISGNTAYIGTANKGAIAFDLNTFEQKWHFDGMQKNLIYTSQYSKGNISTIDGTILEKDGMLYFGGLDGYVYCINKSNGNLIKSIDIKVPILSEVNIVGENLIVFDFSGNVRSLKIS